MNYKEQIKSPLWQRKRLEIMQRDNFTCQCCNSKETHLNVHHLYYLPNTLIYDYDNEAYTTICEDCHEKITKDLSKLAGIIAFKMLQRKIDIVQFYNLIKEL